MSLLLLVLIVVAELSLSEGTMATITDFGPNQPRYWPKYSGKRMVTLLDGTWQTGRLGSIDHPPQNFDSMDPLFNPTSAVTPNIMQIPSCVDNAPPGYLGYRGVSFFRTHFEYDLSQAPARLLFQACSFYCRVWVNGVEIGNHRAGGYVAFYLDIPMQYGKSNDDNDDIDNDQRSKTKGRTTTNELFVLVDNRYNATTAPMHTGGDYWHYSGIMRSVELHTMPPPVSVVSSSSSSSSSLRQQPQQDVIVWPWRLYVLPESLSAVQMTLHLTNPKHAGKVTGTFAFDDGPARTFSGTARNGIVNLGIVEVPNPRIWSIGNGQLHTVSITVDDATVTERFGLRQFGIDTTTSRITVNGDIVKLVGWSHHTQWPESAASPTDQEMDDDLALMLRAGTIYVRGAHYPQDPRWLDRLDEAGVVMWCETLGAGVSRSNTVDPYFIKYQMQQIEEMLDNAMNHASVMIWAFFNEGPSDEIDACPLYTTCATILQQRDPTRLVTYASNRYERDVCLHTVPVVSFNNYPGWYGMNDDPRKKWNEYADNVKKGVYPGSLRKPFLISETGAGGIYEWSENKTAEKWTLAYQTKVIAEDVDVAIENSYISGITLWHFMDFKTFDNTENNTHCDYIPNIYPPICAYINVTKGTKRPGGLNHKGVVDFWRREKPAYQVVAAKYNATRTPPSLDSMEIS